MLKFSDHEDENTDTVAGSPVQFHLVLSRLQLHVYTSAATLLQFGFW